MTSSRPIFQPRSPGHQPASFIGVCDGNVHKPPTFRAAGILLLPVFDVYQLVTRDHGLPTIMPLDRSVGSSMMPHTGPSPLLSKCVW